MSITYIQNQTEKISIEYKHMLDYVMNLKIKPELLKQIENISNYNDHDMPYRIEKTTIRRQIFDKIICRFCSVDTNINNARIDRGMRDYNHEFYTQHYKHCSTIHYAYGLWAECIKFENLLLIHSKLIESNNMVSTLSYLINISSILNSRVNAFINYVNKKDYRDPSRYIHDFGIPYSRVFTDPKE